MQRVCAPFYILANVPLYSCIFFSHVLSFARLVRLRFHYALFYCTTFFFSFIRMFFVRAPFDKSFNETHK